MTKKSYATKSDIRVLKSELVTLEKRIENKILETEVKILGELKDMREEFSELQEHNGRLKRLESAKV